MWRNKNTKPSQTPSGSTDPKARSARDDTAVPNLGIRHASRAGAIGFFVLFGVLGTWASYSKIGGAVIASGQTIVQGKPKLVQSLDGGEVAEIFARDGDTIAKGDLLIRLDPTLIELNLDSARSRLAGALALNARLKAEQARAPEIDFSYGALPFDLPETAVHERIQHEIFNARAAIREGQQEQLSETILQLANQDTGIAGQIAALKDQIALLNRDLDNMRKLKKQGLARQSEMSELERSNSQLTGELARLEAEKTRIADARRDAKLETLQASRSFQEEVVTQMHDVSAEIDNLTVEVVTRYDQLSRIDVAAPAAGIVHQMHVTTLGSVIAPGGEIAQIIPVGGEMDFEVRVDPRSIDQVHLGQGARLMISSLDPQTSPQMKAHVRTVSPDVITDPRNGKGYYNVSLSLEPDAHTQLAMLDIVSGMPVEAFLETGDRSVLSYLLHPLKSHLRKALRE